MFRTIDSVMDEVYAWAHLRLERARELLEKTRRGSTQAIIEVSLKHYQDATDAWVRLGENMMTPEQVAWRLAKVKVIQRHLSTHTQSGIPWDVCFRAACAEVRALQPPPGFDRCDQAAATRPLPLYRRIVHYLGMARASIFSSAGR